MDNYNMDTSKKTMPKEGKKDIKIDDNFEYVINDSEIVKLIIQGGKFADVVFQQRKPRQGIKKLNKYEYVELDTGEIKNFNLSDKKDNLRSLQMTFKRLVELIRCNFTSDDSRQLFITLTYKQNMTDKNRLYQDYDKFYKRLKYKFKEHNFEYITVAEPQARGAWHFHIMLKSDKKLFIEDKVIRKMWKNGITQTTRLKAEDVGRYYVAYFTNMKTEDIPNLSEKEKQQKKYVKGSRLKYYPKNFKFYRCSRGLKKPVTVFKTWGKVVEEYGSPKWQKSYSFYYQDTEGQKQEVNLLHKASFKKDNKK
jgi:hypothetical protein